MATYIFWEDQCMYGIINKAKWKLGLTNNQNYDFFPKADEIVLNIGLNQRTSEKEKKRKREKKRTFYCAT